MTGGGAGIGRAVVEAFVGHGARVEVVDSDESALAELVAAVPPGTVVAHGLDVTAPGAMAELAALGPIDVLVNNVGHFVRARSSSRTRRRRTGGRSRRST